jgi:hypothetical protein
MSAALDGCLASRVAVKGASPQLSSTRSFVLTPGETDRGYGARHTALKHRRGAAILTWRLRVWGDLGARDFTVLVGLVDCP